MLRKIGNPARDLDFGISEVASSSEVFAAFRNLLRRRFRIILSVALLAIGPAAIYVITAPPSFTAQATMIIDSRTIDPLRKQTAMPDQPPDSQLVDSQVEILKSEKIALKVIEQFDLTEDPDFIGPGEGPVGMFVRSASEMRSSAALSYWFGTDETESERDPTQLAAEAFADRLTVTRVGRTSIIEVSFRASQPTRAAEIANATVSAYIADQLRAKSEAAKQAAVWLQDRVLELAEQSTKADQAVVDFKAKNKLVTIGKGFGEGERLLNEQQLSELNSQSVLARANTAEAKARLDRIEKIVTGNVGDALTDATVTDTLNNPVVSKLRSQYLDLANREADWSRRYGKNHLAAVNLRNQMQEIRNSIEAELRRLAETYKSDYEIAEKRLEALQVQLSDAVSQSNVDNQAQIVLGQLQNTAQTYRALHDDFVQRYMENVQGQSFPIAEARLITGASPPLKKSHPKTLLIMAVAGAGGLIFGLGIAQLREWLDQTFRTREQVEAKLGTDCIAVVPKLTVAPVRQSVAATKKLSSKRKSTGTGNVNDSLKWHVLDSPFSRFAEAMRYIRMAIDLKEAGKSSKVIGFTSTLPNEGKSTIASSLAQSIAHSGAKTILVDGDLRNPSLTRLLAPHATAGFFDVIQGDARLEHAVWIDGATGLEFLPQALNSHFPHTNEALASEATSILFDVLRDRYEYVVVDFPPLAPVVDVRGTTPLVDSYVYVVEWGGTKINVVQGSLSEARGVYENLVGVVLNRADMDTMGRYDGYGASFYNNKYYEQYGHTD